MGEKKIVILITAGLLLLTAVFFYTIRDEAENYRSSISADIVVEQTWNLPEELQEVSAIAFLEEDKIASVQDEAGTVFIYNLETSEIEREIAFAEAGDYEGIAVHQNTLFVLRADGMIYRIKDYNNSARVETFDTPFTAKNDMEGLFFDTQQNSLLIAVKEQDPNSEDYKGIYAIDPNSMEMKEDAVYKMTFDEEIFNNKKKKAASDSFFPSEINRNPDSGELLVLEAREPKLLILNSDGTPKALHRLDRKLFPQPEGLAYDAAGNLYISTEGEPGKIHRVSINSK